MKRLISLVLSVVLLFTMIFSVNIVSYADNAIGYYEYSEYYSGGIEITKYSGDEEIVTIPQALNGLKVKSVSASAFRNKDNIKEINVSEGIENIASYAFENMPDLKRIFLSKTVSRIGYNAFYNPGNSLEITFLNPECSIYEFAGIDSSAVIYADEGSTAHKKAVENKNSFVAIDSHYYVSENIIKPATMKEAGEIGYVCNKCKETVSTKAIPKIKEVYLTQTTFTYDSKAHTPPIKVKDENGKVINESNYTVKYDSGRINAGKYKAKVTFNNNYYSGTVTKTITINRKALTKSDVKISNVSYTGKATYPKITYKGSKLKKDKDFTVSQISKNTNFGTATFKVKLIGNYSGTISSSYKILPAKVSSVSLSSRDTSSITVKWNKSKGASGYKVYRMNKSTGKYSLYKTTTKTSLKINRFDKYSTSVEIYIVAYKKSGKTTYTSPKAYYTDCVKPKKLTYGVKCNGSGKIKINITNIDPFEGCNVNIQICKNKSFDSKKYEVYSLYAEIDSWSNDKSVYIYDVPQNKDYYVRCRGFSRDANNKLVYGSWGEIKKVHVK